MRWKGLTLLAVLVVSAGLVGIAGMPFAGASAHPSYPLGKARSCRANYHKHVRDRIVAVRVKVDGTWRSSIEGPVRGVRVRGSQEARLPTTQPQPRLRR